MTFRVGQKVVCVDASINTTRYFWPDDVPVAGRVYTVTSLQANPLVRFNPDDQMTVCLAEIRNRAPEIGGVDAGFALRRFRPAVEFVTDISELREIVADVFRRAKVGS